MSENKNLLDTISSIEYYFRRRFNVKKIEVSESKFYRESIVRVVIKGFGRVKPLDNVEELVLTQSCKPMNVTFYVVRQLCGINLWVREY